MKNTPLWTAIVTPLNEKNEIDFVSLKTLLKEQESAGNGILVLGSTGEGINLTLSEKKEIVKFVVSLELKVPIMACIPGHDLSAALEWIDFLERYPIDTYLMPVPMYAKPSRWGQYHWFDKLLTKASKQVMLYNIPSRVVQKLIPEVVLDLSKKFKHLWAIKESSGSFDDFIKFKKMLPNIKLFSGDDPLFLYLSLVGAEGLVSVASNAWPKEMNELVQMSLQGRRLELESMLGYLEKTNSLFLASNPIPVKWVLFKMKKIAYCDLKLPLHKNDFKQEDQDTYFRLLEQSDFKLFKGKLG